ncbi:HAD family hydrolase [Paenibacillus sp. URB8-2]|uniref:HAD family hydrolase n=1 Tax=Paenibacillus sp. URB8-2 TaxID=2741301 RepID=UPI0015B7D075|nr:HAD family hydrolase [Paenibacillus sp. URB8-2]BCG59350.1 phosphatase [Paenibacillus sp. URB8-2]
MYESIIFDIDGTLIDTEEAVIKGLQKMLETDYGRVVERERLIFALGIPGRDSLPQLGIEDVKRAHDRWNHFIHEFFETVKVFDGIADLLEGLKNKKATAGVVTSKTSQEVIDDFNPFGLTDYMDYTVCSSDTKKHKPNPEPLLKYLEISGADPKKSIYIGDTIYDYQCARDAGIDFGLALWGCINQENIDAKYKFEKPTDILEVVETLK